MEKQYTTRELAYMIRKTDGLDREIRDQIADRLERAKAEICQPERCIAYFDGTPCVTCKWR